MKIETIDKLVKSLTFLPGVGKKTAQKLALHLLSKDRDAALLIAESLIEAVTKVKTCKQCNALSDEQLCAICRDSSRDNSLLCVLESPLDVYAFEDANFKGYYFVLKGSISPIDGIMPNDVGIPELIEFVKQRNFKEVIVATHLTINGEATAHFISNFLKDKVNITRIAYGVPMGGDFSSIDSTTLNYALNGRNKIG